MKAKHLLIFLLFLFYAGTPPVSEKGVYILVYHSFLDKSEFVTDVSLKEFRRQLTSLKKQKFTFVSYGDIMQKRITGTRNILITIDDGNRSAYYAYKRVLKPMGIKPLLAIFTYSIERTPALMSWEMIRELSDDGCDIASHGHYHYQLNEKLFRYNRNAFLREIVLSKKILETKLNRKITAFMYPYGIFYHEVIEELKKAGYAAAFTLKWGPAFIPLKNGERAFTVPRYMVMQNWERIYHSILRSEKR